MKSPRQTRAPPAFETSPRAEARGAVCEPPAVRRATVGGSRASPPGTEVPDGARLGAVLAPAALPHRSSDRPPRSKSASCGPRPANPRARPPLQAHTPGTEVLWAGGLSSGVPAGNRPRHLVLGPPCGRSRGQAVASGVEPSGDAALARAFVLPKQLAGPDDALRARCAASMASATSAGRAETRSASVVAPSNLRATHMRQSLVLESAGGLPSRTEARGADGTRCSRTLRAASGRAPRSPPPIARRRRSQVTRGARSATPAAGHGVSRHRASSAPETVRVHRSAARLDLLRCLPAAATEVAMP